jgi:flagellar biosynthesis component FlhA
VNAQGELPAFLLDPSIERGIESAVEHGELNSVLTMPPEGIREILARLGKKIDKADAAIAITSAGARHFLRQIVESTMANLTVLSHSEIPPELKIRSRGVIE